MDDGKARKVEAGMLVAVGIVMQRLSPPLAAWFEGQQLSSLLVAASHLIGGISIIPIALGLYRLFTKPKTR